MKPFWQSKTLWMNLLIAIAQWADQIPGSTEWQVLVVAAANFLLRFVTAKPITAS